MSELLGSSRDGAPDQPLAPWLPITDNGGGYLSVYFSEPLARWPVREITRPRDNKSDPNIETGTYGLFSTCEPAMRNRIVVDGAATIFFVTTHKKGRGRILSGYYEIGAYTAGTQGEANHDYALAARSIRFIDPIALSELPPPLAATCSAPFRTMKPISQDLVRALSAICDDRPDRTESYIAEVQRIERFSQARSGFSYPSWGRKGGFAWRDAVEFYSANKTVQKVPNSSKTGKWRCSEPQCGYVINNAALLKKCPVCQANSSLLPILEEV